MSIEFNGKLSLKADAVIVVLILLIDLALAVFSLCRRGRKVSEGGRRRDRETERIMQKWGWETGAAAEEAEACTPGVMHEA